MKANNGYNIRTRIKFENGIPSKPVICQGGQTMKKYINAVTNILLYGIFIFIWLIIFSMAFIASKEGVLSVFGDAFGKWTEYTGWILSFLIFLSIVYLRLFFKKKKYVYIISYTATFIFLIAATILLNIGESKFTRFTTDKWINYPERRISMYFDLSTQYNIEGYSKEEVSKLLGEPDDITNDNKYIYDDRHGNAVYIQFNENKVSAIYNIE